ncbi:MAG: CBS domain-containing protein, partial [Chloroflexi bacterium]|nr:CBS domain-containing protein [Chloroflexota bacterium]
RGAQPSTASALSVWELNFILAQLKVAEFMTPRPITVSEDTPVGEAAHLMLRHKISGLPVVDEDGNLAGILTESDIFRLVVRDWTNQTVPALPVMGE